MYDLLLWIGAILMVMGFLGLAVGITIFVDPLLMFMFGSTWNMVLMLVRKLGLIS